MIRVKYEKEVDNPGRKLANLVLLAWHGKHHVQEAATESQGIIGIGRGPAHVMPVTGRGDGGHFCNHSLSRQHTVLRIFHVQPVVIESGQRTHYTRHHGHRVGIIMKTGYKLIQFHMNHRVIGDFLLKRGKFFFERQFSVQQQVSHLEKTALFRQLLYGIPPVTQNTLAAINESQFAGTGRRGGKTRVVGEIAQCRGQRLDVQRGLPFCAFDYR